MLRRSTTLARQLQARKELMETAKSGIYPRIDKSPQGIVYDQKKHDYISWDNRVQEVQRLGTWGYSHRELYGLGEMIDQGEQIFAVRPSTEDEVLRVRNKVFYKRRMQERVAKARAAGAQE